MDWYDIGFYWSMTINWLQFAKLKFYQIILTENLWLCIHIKNQAWLWKRFFHSKIFGYSIWTTHILLNNEFNFRNSYRTFQVTFPTKMNPIMSNFFFRWYLISKVSVLLWKFSMNLILQKISPGKKTDTGWPLDKLPQIYVTNLTSQ